MGSIIVREVNGETRVLASESPKYEEILKRNISEIPRLIPLDMVTDEDVIHITIGEEWRAGGGRADVVLLGSDAVITVVETKLKRNPEARREVIAQVLEYGAYLTEWTIAEITQRASDFFQSETAAPELRGKLLAEALRPLFDEDEDLESFKNRVEQNLRQGKIRLVIAVDGFGEQAKKIVTFINSYSSFEIYLLEISAYQEDGGRQIFVPSLYGYARKVVPSREPTQWDWAKFETDLGWSADEVERAERLNARLEELTETWHPEFRFRGGWTNFYFGGRKSPFGVTRSKQRGVELWFRLTESVDTHLPRGTHIRKLKNYIYLSGPLEDITDDAILAYCRAAAVAAELDVPLNDH